MLTRDDQIQLIKFLTERAECPTFCKDRLEAFHQGLIQAVKQLSLVIKVEMPLDPEHERAEWAGQRLHGRN